MQVTVCSRDAAEALISSGRFPQNTAVISFCDPPDRHGGEAYAPVDYSTVCGDACYCELEDLDRDYLPERGYTYESFFPDAAPQSVRDHGLLSQRDAVADGGAPG